MTNVWINWNQQWNCYSRDHAELKVIVNNIKDESFKSRTLMQDIFTALMGSITDPSKPGLLTDHKVLKEDYYRLRPTIERMITHVKVGSVFLAVVVFFSPLILDWVKHFMGWKW